MEDAVDPSVGFVITAKPGDVVQNGEPLATVFARDRAGVETGLATLRQAITIARRSRASAPAHFSSRHVDWRDARSNTSEACDHEHRALDRCPSASTRRSPPLGAVGVSFGVVATLRRHRARLPPHRRRRDRCHEATLTWISAAIPCAAIIAAHLAYVKVLLGRVEEERLTGAFTQHDSGESRLLTVRDGKC